MASGGRTRTTRPKFDISSALTRLEEVYGKSRFISRFEPMDELISCILSQHSSDAASFPAFTHFRSQFPQWDMVIDAGPEGIVDSIRKAGLANQKSKSIVNTLRAIHERTGDYSLELLRTMPTEDAVKWLLELPGVGPKTASIVMCFSFGRHTIPVDTHVFRVSRRLGLIGDKVDENAAHKVLLNLVPEGDAFRFHTVLIQHGRQTCKAPIPVCAECAITDLCPWFKKIGPEKHRLQLAKARKSK